MKRMVPWLLTSAPAGVLAITSALGPFGLDVAAGGVGEHCVKLDAGDRVRYRYTATAEVDFNIHYHRGDEVIYPVKTVATRSADATFTAPHSDSYCLMWVRKGDAAARIEGAVERTR